MHQIHELHGCTPDPLMAYLKALGVFRIVAEQKDQDARAWWQNDTFHLKSSMDRDELIDFFLNQYTPTPIASPWNGGSGFQAKDNDKAMRTILALESPRFQNWNQVISICKKILAQPEATAKGKKEWILAQCRAQFPDEALAWLDAAYVLTSKGPKYPPLLGTGGNDGRLEFSNNFMQNLVSALNLDEQRNGASIAKSQAAAALFNEGSPELRKRTSGFYNPGSVGGANAAEGFEGDALTNPWDYVLMFEGALLFAGASARRLSPQAESKAVFPFTADNSAAGYGTSASSEYGGSSRAEFWAPLWNRPANLQELKHLMSEGRAQLGRKQASNGANFARAVVGLGTELGIAQFQRYGFMVRNGLAYLAAPLGRFQVRERQSDTQRAADVLFDLDPWLEGLRRAAAGQKPPAGLGTALRQVDQAIIEFCQSGQPRDLQNVLIAAGRAERWLATSSLHKGKNPVRPLNNLSQDWLQQANDGSVAFRLARAVASVISIPGKGNRQVGPIRENLEPVSASQRDKWAEWKEDSPSFVWKSGDALSNMLSVLERRCLDGRMNDLGHPPLNAAYTAQLSDIAEFLNGNVDLQRFEDLILPLSFIRHGGLSEEANQRHSQPPAPLDLPAAYAAMKLTLLPGKLVWASYEVGGTDIWAEPAMLAMLRAGRLKDAYALAYRRLRASGLKPLTESPGIADRSPAVHRLAAALLFPLDAGTQAALAEISLAKPERIDDPA